MIKSKSGFTLIEALVALVILSGIFAVVWSWFNTAVISSARIERAVALPSIFDEFTDHLHTQSLKQQRSGEYNSGDFQLQWRATPVRESVNEIYRRQPDWQVSLFKIDIDIYHHGELLQRLETQYVDVWKDPLFGLSQMQGL